MGQENELAEGKAASQGQRGRELAGAGKRTGTIISEIVRGRTPVKEDEEGNGGQPHTPATPSNPCTLAPRRSWSMVFSASAYLVRSL